jgi:hypothetical protein
MYGDNNNNNNNNNTLVTNKKTDIFEIASQQPGMPALEYNTNSFSLSAIDFALQPLIPKIPTDQIDTEEYRKKFHTLEYRKNAYDLYAKNAKHYLKTQLLAGNEEDFLHCIDGEENKLFENEFYSLNIDILNTIKELLRTNYEYSEKKDLIFELNTPVFEYIKDEKCFILNLHTACDEVSAAKTSARYVLSHTRSGLIKTSPNRPEDHFFEIEAKVKLDLTDFPKNHPKVFMQIIFSTTLENIYYIGGTLDPYKKQTETLYNFNLCHINSLIENEKSNLNIFMSQITVFYTAPPSVQHLPIIFSSLESLFRHAITITLLKLKKNMLTQGNISYQQKINLGLKELLAEWKMKNTFSDLLNELDREFEILFKDTLKNISSTLKVFYDPLIEKIFAFANHIKTNNVSVDYQKNNIYSKNTLFIVALNSIQTGLLEVMTDRTLKVLTPDDSISQKKYEKEFSGNAFYLEYLEKTDNIFSMLLEINDFISETELTALKNQRRLKSKKILSGLTSKNVTPTTSQEVVSVSLGKVKQTVTCVSRQALYATLLERSPFLLGLNSALSGFYTILPYTKLFFQNQSSVLYPYLIISQPLFAVSGFWEGMYTTLYPKKNLPKPLQFLKTFSNSLTILYFLTSIAIQFSLYFSPQTTEESDAEFMFKVQSAPLALVALYYVWQGCRKNINKEIIDRTFNFLFNFMLAGGITENIALYYYPPGQNLKLMLPLPLVGLVPAILQETRLKETTSLVIRISSTAILSYAFVQVDNKKELLSANIANLTYAIWGMAFIASGIFTLKNTVRFRKIYEEPIVIIGDLGTSQTTEELKLLLDPELAKNIKNFENSDENTKQQTWNTLEQYQIHLETSSNSQNYNSFKSTPKKKNKCCC